MKLPKLPEIDFLAIGPRIGEPFPDMELPNQLGEMVNVRDHQGGHKLIFVVYRSADW